MAPDGHGAASPSTPRASWPPPAARPARCRPGCGSASSTRRSRPPAQYQDIFGKENYFLEIMDHGLDIERRVRDGLTEIGQQAGHPAGGHQRLALHLRVAGRARTTCCCACRPAATSPTRTGSGSTAAATTSSPPTRCARSTPPTLWQRGLPQHPAGRREGRHRPGMFDVQEPDAALPGARGRDRGVLVPQGGLRRAWTAASRTASRGARRAGRVRARRHHPDGLPVLLPRGRRLHQVGEEPAASRSARAVARRPARWSRTRWASPTSTRCRTA